MRTKFDTKHININLIDNLISGIWSTTQKKDINNKLQTTQENKLQTNKKQK